MDLSFCTHQQLASLFGEKNKELPILKKELIDREKKLNGYKKNLCQYKKNLIHLLGLMENAKKEISDFDDIINVENGEVFILNKNLVKKRKIKKTNKSLGDLIGNINDYKKLSIEWEEIVKHWEEVVKNWEKGIHHIKDEIKLVINNHKILVSEMARRRKQSFQSDRSKNNQIFKILTILEKNN
jgi:hypothetical protein